ncbi:30S ribosomal protein S15, partial [bacterium]|nr:30S ribosomal protein S15 [bacterium]
KITGKSISAIVNENNLLKTIPEDLNALVNKAKNLKKHLEFNKRDIHNRRGLLLIESKIRRLSKYYKKKEVLPKNWSY